MKNSDGADGVWVCGGSGLDMPEGRSQSRASAPHGAQVYRAKTK